MRNLPQWINWRLLPGVPKARKVPFDLATGQPIDPHDPTRWISHARAMLLDPAHTGFVLTAGDPYFCIDLDHAWDGAAWSPLALAVVAMFPGAYVEVSYSGDGLHIIGQGTPPAGYSTRGPGIEFYSASRFIAITGHHATGDPDTRHDLSAFAALYLKPASDAGTPAEWTSQPCAGSNPIADDDELVRKMLAARQSAGVAFGGKASASDLWTANATALADAWPSQTDAWDRSAADAALAAHLAFWTGKDCARIERLMRRSALLREKWDRRGDDYLKRTIVGAVSRVSKVYDVGIQQAGSPPPSRAGWQYLTVEQQHEHFAGCVYVADMHRVFMPNGNFLKPEAFNAIMGGFDFQMAYDQSKPAKKAFEAFTESRATKFPKAETTCFRPDLQPAQIVTLGASVAVNTYVPALVDMQDGDPAPFLDLMTKLFPDETDREIMTCYLAALRQHPGVKFRWCPLLQGVEGNLKGAITKIAEYCVSEGYTHRVNAKELGDSGAKFTGWLERKLLVVIEEIYVSDRRELLDTIKPLITDDRVEIQRKGVDQKTGENRANFILTSNHKDAIAKTRNDRRYAIFYTGQQTVDDLARDGMSGDYGPRLYAWLRGGGYAIVAGYLQRYEIPDRLNPATLCHRAPLTSSTEAAIAESRGVVEQCILEACEEGRAGFAGGWISSVALSGLLMELRRTVSPRKRGDLLKSIGYVKHPALGVTGQASAGIFAEGMKRPYIYVREGSINYINLQDEQSVINAYVKAQGYALSVVSRL